MAEKKKKTADSKAPASAKAGMQDSDSQGGWKGLSPLLRTAIIAISVIALCVAIGFIFYGRSYVISNGMEDTYAKNSTVFFSRFSSPDFNDVVLFHHPETDTIVPSNPDINYYMMCRKYGKSWCKDYELKAQNKKRRPIYLSRVVGLPGETVAIKNGVVLRAEGKSLNPIADAPASKDVYIVGSTSLFSSAILDTLGLTKEGMSCEEINPEDIIGFYRHKTAQGISLAAYALTAAQAEALKSLPSVSMVEKVALPEDHFDKIVFPYAEQRHFNISYMTPMLIPAKGKVIKLDPNNLPFYRRCIEAFENKTVEVDGAIIYIGGKETDSYRFSQDYYFVVNDNRATTDDSRFFGFLPESHIKGVVL